MQLTGIESSRFGTDRGDPAVMVENDIHDSPRSAPGDLTLPLTSRFRAMPTLDESCASGKTDTASQLPSQPVSPRSPRTSALQQRRRLGANLQLALGKKPDSGDNVSPSPTRLSPGWSPSQERFVFSPREMSPSEAASTPGTSPPSWCSALQERRRARVDSPSLLPHLQLDLQAVVDEDNFFFQDQAVCLTERYELLKALGQGTTGVVYAARRKADGRQVALKTMRTTDEELVRIAHQEFTLLNSIRHPHIIQALDFFAATDRTVVVLEFFDGHTLDKTVGSASGRRLSERVAYKLFVALMQAIAHLHQIRIVHRDVKAQNVLVARDLKDLRLIDFNTARRLSDGALTMTGTQLYLAPEVLLGESPSEGSDVWSAGLCLHIMLSGRLPQAMYRYKGCFADFAAAVSSKQTPLTGRRWQHVSKACKATLLRCLEINKCLRPTATTILEDPWVRDGPDRRNISPSLQRCRTVQWGRRASEPASAPGRRRSAKLQRRARTPPPKTTSKSDPGRARRYDPPESFLLCS
mmetsp:Transcript_162453/g.296546  ORF Transcript_162453/g.296546 Transcript_162453/m.296546 type:complete len:524 (+) Transcript_162453:176-1747(+)